MSGNTITKSNESLKKTSKIEIKPDINYEKEVTLLFYNSILENLIENISELEKEVNPCETQSTLVPNSEEIVDSDVTKERLSETQNKINVTNELSQQTPGRNTSMESDDTGSIRTNMNSFSRITEKSIKPSLINNNSNLETNWMIYPKTARMRMYFINGNEYEGDTYQMQLHGKGVFRWANGTHYVGDFEYGQISGNGKMIYPDNTYYEGYFCRGYFHGCGLFNIANSDMIYKGEWRQGMKHGKGWMYYGKMNWYEGGWYKNQRNGFGLRQYPDRSIYNGYWSNGKQNGEGVMYWNIKDFYKGTWKNGLIHGEGTYIWKINAGTDFAQMNNPMYSGSWSNGLRHGNGILHFAIRNDSKLEGVWHNNMKHGPGIFYCNGNTVNRNPLFLNDKPFHYNQMDSSELVLKKSKILCKPITIRSQIGLIDANYSFLYETALNKYHKLLSGKSTLALQTISTVSKVGHQMSLSSLSNIHLAESSKPVQFASSLFKNEDYRNYRLYMSLKDNEEKTLRTCIRNNIQFIANIFYSYCTMYQQEKKIRMKFVPHRGLKMLRIMMWIFYMDIGIPQKYMSLIEIDNLIAENPQLSLTSIHDPFESFTAYTFLVGIIAVAWKIYSEILIVENLDQQSGMVAFAYKKFKEDFLSDLEVYKSFNLSEYVDLVPLKQVYMLYKDIGEPHTVRHFLCRCCKKNIRWTCSVEEFTNKNRFTIRGYNAFSFNLWCILNPSKILYKDFVSDKDDSDPFFRSLLVFSKLGSKTILNKITKVCPLVLTDNQITWIDYPLSFIEFYRILIMCVEALIELQKDEASEVFGEVESKSTTTSAKPDNRKKNK